MRSLVAAVVLLGASAAFAQTQTQTPPPLGGEVKPANALRITLSGGFSFTAVYRDRDVFNAALGNATTGAAGSTLVPQVAGETGNGSDFFFDPMITLNMDFELANAVHAVVELETQHHEFITGTRSGGVFGQDRDVEVEQAYVRWERAMDQDLTLQIGIQDFAKDFAGTGNPFLVDVQHSESPFNNPGAAGADFGAPQSSSSGMVGMQEAAGVWAQMGLGDSTIDFFYFTIAETFRNNSDDAMYGASFELTTEGDNETSFGVIVMGLENDSTSRLWTFGGGGYTKLASNSLKIYGEAYGQTGQYGEVQAAGQAQSRTIEQHGSFAAFGGIQYFLPGMEGYNAYIDASYWEVSGDDEGADFRNENFVSLENNNDLIVVEDGYYGLDLDANYRAIKIKAGFDPAESITCRFTYAFVELQDNNGTAGNSVSTHDRIGNEFDIDIRYRATDNLVFRARTGWLFDSKVLGVRDELNVTAIEASIQF